MFGILKNLTKKNLVTAFIAVIFIVCQVKLELTMPDYMSEITRLTQTEGSAMEDILSSGGKMLLCAWGSLMASVLTAVCAARISSDLSANLREKLFDKVQSFSMEEIGKFSTASLITRSTNDITQVQTLIVMGLQVIIKAPIMAVWAIIKISGKGREWTISTAAAVVIMLLLVGICIAAAAPKFMLLQKYTDDLNRVTRENLTGLNVIRAYNAEKYQENKFDKANDELTSAHLFTSRVMAFMSPSLQLINSGLSLAIYLIGAALINKAQLPEKITLFSDMVVFSQYAVMVIMSFMMLVMIFIILPRASVSAKRINEVLNTEVRIKDGEKTEGVHGKTGEIEFKNVSFTYPDADAPVLENISFKAHKGETVALIGATGCGKSSVINLIPRFYDSTEGEVLVDGVNVREYSQYALRNKIGYISQKATLFSGSVSSNIAFGDNGRNKMKDDIVNAVYTAQASDFVENMENGYDGYIAQGGSNLSGGQKQRLSIARAVCRQPEILIFDDSFSALDYRTDRKLRTELKKDCRDATKIIVAQRIGTIKDADRIIVLDDGKIAGQGTHGELMNNCGVYRQIALSQLSKEELA